MLIKSLAIERLIVILLYPHRRINGKHHLSENDAKMIRK